MQFQETQTHLAHLRAQLESALEPRTRIDILNELAWLERDFDAEASERSSAEAYALSTQGEFENAPYLVGMIEALRTQSVLCMWRGLNAQAIEKGARALELLRRAPNVSLEIQVRCNITWVWLRTSDMEQAMENALPALELAHHSQNLEGQAWVFDALCGIYARIGEWQHALTNAIRARDLARASGDVRIETYMYNNLAWLHCQVGETETGLQEINLCLARAQEYGYTMLYVAALGTAGEIYLAQRDYARAIAEFQKFLTHAQRAAMWNEQIYAHLNLGNAHQQNGQLEQAVASAQTALALAVEQALPLEQADCHQLLAKIFEQQNDFSSALTHYKAFQELREQVVYQAARRVHTVETLNRLRRAERALDAASRETQALLAELAEHKHARATLHELASRDALTQVWNRRHFMELAERVLLQRSSHESVALILFDIDNFKTVNDTYGHAAGDAVLQAVAARVHEHLRSRDLFGRMGGDEFIILLPNTFAHEAHAIAGRLRFAVGSHAVHVAHHFIHVSLSIGVAYCAAQQLPTLIEMIDTADQALYQAKRAGRNQVALREIPATLLAQ